MADVLVAWDLEDDPEGNAQHIAEHDITMAEVEEVLLSPFSMTTESRTSGNPITFGYTLEGRYLAVIWREESSGDPYVIYPVTAFDVPEPAR